MMAHPGNPVVNGKGERIGWATSCAIDGERFLTGQAYLENGYTKQGRHAYWESSRGRDGSPRNGSEGGESVRFPKL
jgi:hypothetical protein